MKNVKLISSVEINKTRSLVIHGLLFIDAHLVAKDPLKLNSAIKILILAIK